MAETPTDEDLFSIIAREALVDRAKLNRDVALADSGVTSLDIMNVLFVVEDTYEVHIDETDLKTCRTLGDFVDLLKSRVGAPA
jgi:acyl carrier protein